MHRIGGLEKQDITGNVNYEPANHQHMVNTRAKKVENVASQIRPAGGRRTDDRRPARPELGRHLRRVQDGRRSLPGAGPVRRPRPPAVAQPLPEEPGAGPAELQEGADPRAEHGPAPHAHSRQIPDRRPGPEQGPGPAVRRAGGRQRDPRSSSACNERPARQGRHPTPSPPWPAQQTMRG